MTWGNIQYMLWKIFKIDDNASVEQILPKKAKITIIYKLF